MKLASSDKIRATALICALCLTLFSSSRLDAREWTLEGAPVEATLLHVCNAPETDAKAVALRRFDDRVIIAPLEILSDADRKFVADYESGAIDANGVKRVVKSWAPEAEAKARAGKFVGTPQKYALLVGINQYEELSKTHWLNFCESDMELLAQTLIQSGFPKENVFVMSTQNLAPTKEAIEWQLKTLLPTLKPRDLLVVAFSGHGVMLTVDGVARSYLCPSDLRTDVDSFEELADLMIPRSFVDELIRDCPARSKILICDACRSEDFKDAFPSNVGSKSILGDGIESGTQTASEVADANFCILSSCRPKFKSNEIASLGGGHGLFTWFLVEALRGYADAPKNGGDGDGKVGVLEAFNYTHKKMFDYEVYVDGERYFQLPTSSGNFDDEFNLTVCLPNLPPLADEKSPSPQDETSREQTKKIEAALNLALQYFSDDLFELATQETQKILEIDPEHPIALNLTKQIEKGAAEFEAQKRKADDASQPIVDKNGLEFRLIPAGEFTMGDLLTPEEIIARFPDGGELTKRYAGGRPPRKVQISQSFYMGAKEIAVGDFRKFVEATGYKTTAEKKGAAFGFDLKAQRWGDVSGLNWNAPGFAQTDDCPATCLSWFDAKAYVDWLNENGEFKNEAGETFVYALPTEAQWEYACRAGETSNFFWGESVGEGEGFLNAGDKSGSLWGGQWTSPFPFNDGFVATAPGGSFKPNKFGLYDMAGNVWEWCADWYDANYYSRAPKVDPSGPWRGERRVLRGGGWYSFPESCRAALRYDQNPDACAYDYGFRVALVRPKNSDAPKKKPVVTEDSYANDDGTEFRLIPAGKFKMGDTQTPEEVQKQFGGQKRWYENAHPRHEVEISKAFYLAKYETTVAEFHRFIQETGYQTTAESGNVSQFMFFGVQPPRGELAFQRSSEPGVQNVHSAFSTEFRWNAPQATTGDRHPVVYVSWFDANAYVDWLNSRGVVEINGERYRYALPTEAQWEYACRAGSETTYFWGEAPKGGEGYLNKGFDEKFFPFDDGYPETAPVGSFKPNAWGLYDMLGNVYEWCADWGDDQNDSYYAKSPSKDPTGPIYGVHRIIRGGSWNLDARDCRVANRTFTKPHDRNNYLGFRVALVSADLPLSPTEPLAPVVAVAHVFPENAYMNADGTVFCQIPAGEFTMGESLAPKTAALLHGDQESWYEQARPRRKVKISRPFYMAQCETTIAEFRKFVDATGYKTTAEIEEKSWGFSLKSGAFAVLENLNWRSLETAEDVDNFPATHVSWFDAQKYVEWLNRNGSVVIDGERYRYALPTEAQWEYACRAGCDEPFFWGKSDLDGEGFLNGADIVGAPNGKNWTNPVFLFDDGYRAAAPVGRYSPNAWGLYDALGNVWEWCADAAEKYPNVDETDPTGPNVGPDGAVDETIKRIRRGGSWADGPPGCRSGTRDYVAPTTNGSDLGFRVALVPEVATPKNQSSKRKAGSRNALTINGVEYAFRWCPPGQFETTQARQKRRVTLTQGFWILETEVTQEMWKNVMKTEPFAFCSKGEFAERVKGLDTSLFPVERVGWDECRRFLDKLNQKAPKNWKFDFPTEAQWEYACRAGSTVDFAKPSERLCWNQATCGHKSEPTSRPHAVKTKEPNAWGIYDIQGNVWEWCRDRTSGEQPQDVEIVDLIDPVGPSAGDRRLACGGAWDAEVGYSAPSARLFASTDARHNYLGLRFVLIPKNEKNN